MLAARIAQPVRGNDVKSAEEVGAINNATSMGRAGAPLGREILAGGRT